MHSINGRELVETEGISSTAGISRPKAAGPDLDSWPCRIAFSPSKRERSSIYFVLWRDIDCTSRRRRSRGHSTTHERWRPRVRYWPRSRMATIVFSSRKIGNWNQFNSALNRYCAGFSLSNLHSFISNLIVENVAVIFWMTHLEGIMPAELRQVLVDPNIMKVGFALDREDAARLANEFDGLRVVNAVDVAADAAQCGFQKSGLKSMTESLLGAQLSKALRMSNWGARTLSHEQLHYAATDAYVSLLLHHKLKAVIASLLSGEDSCEHQLMTDSIKDLVVSSKSCPAITVNICAHLNAAVGAPVPKTFSCPHCHKKFPTEGSYNNHILATKHAEPTVNVVVPDGPEKRCSGCTKKFSADHLYIQHILQTRHDLPKQDAHPLPWMPQVKTLPNGTRTISFYGGQTVTKELPVFPQALSASDRNRKKTRVDPNKSTSSPTQQRDLRHHNNKSAPSTSGNSSPAVSRGSESSPPNYQRGQQPSPVAARAAKLSVTNGDSLPVPRPAAPSTASATQTPQALSSALVMTIEVSKYKEMEEEIDRLRRALKAAKKRVSQLETQNRAPVQAGRRPKGASAPPRE